MHRLTPRALLVVALAATAGVGVLAAKQDDARPAAKPSFPANLFARGGITATAQAAPPGIVSAAVSVYTSRQLPGSVAIAAFNAAHQAGAVGLTTEGATLGMTAVVRAGKVVQDRGWSHRRPTGRDQPDHGDDPRHPSR